MLNTIYFDGFKNLKDIKLELKPGLNVLVGPNGSGKSNILQALEFTSCLFKFKLNEITKQMGVENADELFWIPTHSELDPCNIKPLAGEALNSMIMSIEFSGTTKDLVFNPKSEIADVGFSEENFIEFLVDYDYRCKISFQPFDQKPLIYLNQSVKLELSLGSESELGKSSLEFEYDGSDLKLKSADTLALKENTDILLDQFLLSIKNMPTGKLVDESLLAVMSEEFFPATNVLDDIDFGKAYDISTDSIRYDQQIFRPGNFEYSGKGLYSELVFLANSRPDLFEEIIGELKLIFPLLVGFEIPKPEFGQSFSIFVKVKQNLYSDSFSSIPIELLSDGILKWFALVLAINLSENYLIFDEPDFHLDTEMHAELAELLRCELNEFDRVGIITTHNETLVNVIKPEELLLLDFDSGELTINRMKQKDLSRLKEDMRTTNFKLGWYFNTGALKLYFTETKLENGDRYV